MSKKLFLALAILCIVPIWLFEFVPLVDYPKHLFIAHTIGNFGQGQEAFFELNFFWVPNSLGYAFLIALNFLMPIYAAGKAFLTILILLFIFGAKYFFNSVNRSASWLPFLAITFAFTTAFTVGFLNFMLGIAIALFALGYWIKNIESCDPKARAALTALLLLVYLSHLIAFFALLFVMAIASIAYFRRAKQVALSLLPYAPSLIIFAALLLSSPVPSTGLSPVIWPSFEASAAKFIYLLGPIPNALGLASMLFAFAALAVVVFELISGEKHGRLLTARCTRAALLAPVLIGTFLFPLLPSSIGWYDPVAGRFVPLFLFAAVAAVGEPKKPALKKAFACLAVGAAVLAIAGLFLFFAQSQGPLADYVSGIPLVEENSLLLPLSEPWDCLKCFPVTLHAACYYLIERGGVSPYLYLTGMFPLSYKEESFGISPKNLSRVAPVEHISQGYRDEKHAAHFDYVLAQGNREGFEQELEKSFEKIHEKGQFALYRKKN